MDVLSAHLPRDLRALSTSSPACEEPVPVFSLPGDPCIPKLGALTTEINGMHHLGEEGKPGCFEELWFFKLCHPEEFWEHGAVSLCYCHYDSGRCFSGENPKETGDHSQRTFTEKT